MMERFNDLLTTIRRDPETRIRFLLLGMCLCGLCLAFPGLNQYALWSDEAETGFIAKSVVRTGLPYAHDGTQLYPGSSDYYDEHLLWMQTPWIQFYITALSFKLLGIDGFSARLPFMMIGLLTVLWFYYIAKRLCGVNTALVTAFLLFTSVPYLLHIRQCRYFALLAFGTAWGLWAYLKFKHDERYAVLHVVGAAVFLFYSHYAYFFAFMAGMSLTVMINDRPIAWKKIIPVLGCIFICTFPWALYADLLGRRDTYGGWSLWSMITNLGYYIEQAHRHVFPIMTLPLIVLFFDRSGWRNPERLFYLCIPALWVIYLMTPTLAHTLPLMYQVRVYLGGMLFMLTVIWVYRSWDWSALPHAPTRLLLIFLLGAAAGLAVVIPNSAIRYLTGIMPVIYLLTAILIVALWRRSRIIGAAGAVCLAGTNLIYILPMLIIYWLPFNAQSFEGILRAPVVSSWTSRMTGLDSAEIQQKLNPKLTEIDSAIAQYASLRAPLLDYMYERIYPYQGPVEAVVRYLQEHGSPGETLSTDSDYIILAFHTGMKIVKVGVKTEQLTSDWVSIRPHQFYATHPAWWVRHFYDEVLTPFYDKIELNAPDLPNIVYHAPDPNLHVFRVDHRTHPKMAVFQKKRSSSYDEIPSGAVGRP